MFQPLVSVIMCTYNGSWFIDEQIESILGQDYKNLELIIVDDVSTDDTWKKLQKWQQQNNVIKVYQNPVNLGYNKNFECAIQRANGKFIAISDQDDIWLPSKISRQAEALNKNDILLSHSRSVRFENGRLRFKSASLHHHFKGNDTCRLFMFNQVSGHDMLFKKELINKFIPIPNGVMYDWWIAVVATCYGGIAGVDEYLTHHRIHSHNNFFTVNATSKKRELGLEDTLKLFNELLPLSIEQKSFLLTFLDLLDRHHQFKQGLPDVKLFRFLYSNKTIIFGHKRRFLPWLCYVKNALKYSKLNYRGNGLCI